VTRARLHVERELDWSASQPFEAPGRAYPTLAYLRRPFSLAGRSDGQPAFDLS